MKSKYFTARTSLRILKTTAKRLQAEKIRRGMKSGDELINDLLDKNGRDVKQ